MTAERQHYNVTLAVLALAGLAYSLQQTMIVPVLPSLRRDLHTSTAWVTWLLTAFLLVSAVATPVLGKLGDQYGKERFLLVSLFVFFVGCFAAIFAWDIWSLIVFRAIQGFGGAVFPLSFAIVFDEFPREKVGSGVGMVSAILGIGGGLGLVLSGVLVDYASWRWLFIVGAAVVGVAAVGVWRFVPESPVKTPSRLDPAGAALLSATLVTLLLALTEGPTWGWRSGRVLGLFAASAVLAFAWVRTELRVPEPMVDIRMMLQRTVLFTNLTAIFTGFAMFGAFVLLPSLMQTHRGGNVHYGFGLSPTATGLYLLPGGLLGFLAGPAAGRLGTRYGSRLPLVFGLILAAAGISWLALFHSQPVDISVGMVFIGIGVPFAFAAMAKLIVDAVRPSETGIATGMNTVMRTIGSVIGGQVGAAIVSADTIAHTHVPAESAFIAAFWVSAVVAVIGAALARFIPSHRAASSAFAD
ncbi:MAG: MFS transporter [Thermoleophilia bacterium]|nr:MFS transporter [Thermoleophilia bacterium]